MIDIESLPDKLFLEIFERIVDSLFKIFLIHLIGDNNSVMDKLLVCFPPVISQIFAALDLARLAQSGTVSRNEPLPVYWSWILTARHGIARNLI